MLLNYLALGFPSPSETQCVGYSRLLGGKKNCFLSIIIIFIFDFILP